MTHTTKRAASLVAVFCMLVSLVASFGCVNASADTTFANFYSSEVYFSKYGVTDRYVFIQTDGSHNNQEVYAHYKYGTMYNNETGEWDEVWGDSLAQYVTTLSDGSKIWKASIRNNGGESQYAIKYVANGVEYWNNNNGNDFTTETLGDNCNITINRGGCNYYYGSYISAVVKNLAYEKTVKVRVTYDNWNSYEDVALGYSDTRADGTEVWNVRLDKQIANYENFHYCLYYTVNGQTYWANNFGANYDTTTKLYPY